jgi:shikimate kinase
MTGGALRTQEAKTDAAIRKLVTVIPDVTPEGLIEGFKNRKQRKTLTRETSRARQQEHDALLRRRNELVEELARTKEELYNADASLDEDAATRARFLSRPGGPRRRRRVHGGARDARDAAHARR